MSFKRELIERCIYTEYIQSALEEPGWESITLDEFPSPDALWQRYINNKSIQIQKQEEVTVLTNIPARGKWY